MYFSQVMMKLLLKPILGHTVAASIKPVCDHLPRLLQRLAFLLIRRKCLLCISILSELSTCQWCYTTGTGSFLHSVSIAGIAQNGVVMTEVTVAGCCCAKNAPEIYGIV